MFFNVEFTYGEEEQSPLKKVCNVVEDGPGLHVDPVGGDFVIVDTVEKQREGLEEDEGCHDPVDTEHLFRTGLLEDENPEAAGQEEEDGRGARSGGARQEEEEEEEGAKDGEGTKLEPP